MSRDNLCINDLIKKVTVYEPLLVWKVKKAYEYAKTLHEGQYRQSGEPYIIHPLNVAYILAEMNADIDTICAGLLHDTLEDTKATKKDIVNDFNETVANLVDGVTKLSKMNFSSKQDENYANTRKIITSITEDVRIIIIKLADRLHNMRTLQYKTLFKQKENAMETMDIFVPMAYAIGAYRIKSELEDLSLQYLYPDKYQQIAGLKLKLENESIDSLRKMKYKIISILEDKKLENEIKIRTKNIYGIYKKINEGQKLNEIHDLVALKVMVDELDDCYRTLGFVHNVYHPVNSKFKDFICNPKTNMYRSLHTTVFGPENQLVQVQIRTFAMDKVDSFGLPAYWSIKKGNARNEMQEDLKKKFQFFKSLVEINSMFGDNQEFVTQVKQELFSDKVYVYTPKGDVVELPNGSTPIDFAYKISNEVGNNLVCAYVNGERVPINYILKNKDRIKIISNDLSHGPKKEWADVAQTSYARKRILDFNDK